MHRTIYIVHINKDTTEGRGPMVPVCSFSNQKEAEKVAEALEPYGNTGQFHTVTPFPLYDQAEEYIEYPTEENERKKALNKLTVREKHLLGLE